MEVWGVIGGVAGSIAAAGVTVQLAIWFATRPKVEIVLSQAPHSEIWGHTVEIRNTGSADAQLLKLHGMKCEISDTSATNVGGTLRAGDVGRIAFREVDNDSWLRVTWNHPYLARTNSTWIAVLADSELADIQHAQALGRWRRDKSAGEPTEELASPSTGLRGSTPRSPQKMRVAERWTNRRLEKRSRLK